MYREGPVFRKIVMPLVVAFILILPAMADIKEKQLEAYKSAFREKIIRDNPGKEAEIRECLNGMIKEGVAGIRLIDKFALFGYDSSCNGLVFEKVRFIRDGSGSIFLITLKDKSDGQVYSLFLEYIYNSTRGAYSLGDVSFSRVFEEKMSSVRDFFGGD